MYLNKYFILISSVLLFGCGGSGDESSGDKKVLLPIHLIYLMLT